MRLESTITVRYAGDLPTIAHEAAHALHYLRQTQSNYSRSWSRKFHIIRRGSETWRSQRLVDDHELVRSYAAYDYNVDGIQATTGTSRNEPWSEYEVGGHTFYLPSRVEPGVARLTIARFMSQVEKLPPELAQAIDKVRIDTELSRPGVYRHQSKRTIPHYKALRRTCEHIAVDTEEFFMASRDPDHKHAKRVYELLSLGLIAPKRLAKLVRSGFLSEQNAADLEMRTREWEKAQNEAA